VAGEYLLAVNGRELRATDNVYRAFEGTADRPVVLRVGRDPNGVGAREMTVVPLGDEFALRRLAWMEENRRKGDRMIEGRGGGVSLSDTGGLGPANCNRYYFAQIDKEGAVIDERFNSGGSVPDYIIDYLRRPLLNQWMHRDGEDRPAPYGVTVGPKVM